MPTSQAIILSDDTSLESLLARPLGAAGLTLSVASSVARACSALEAYRPSLIVVDLELSTGDPLEFVAGVVRSERAAPVLVLAGPRSIDQARNAIDIGAAGYLRKPLLEWEVERAVTGLSLTAAAALSVPEDEEDGTVMVHGSSPAMQGILKILEHAARSDEHLLLTGEPGSGKRFLGRLIHRESRRRGVRFMGLSCNGLSESVVDRELFGHNGPQPPVNPRGRPGRLESCNHGTILLDEVGDLPQTIQEKVLRFMVEGRLVLSNGNSHPLDVRIIATSSRNLEAAVESGRFLQELFDRLRSISIAVPPLRERRSDIPFLVDQQVRRTARNCGKRLEGVSASALARLMQYDWPGNVRELEDLVSHAVTAARGPVLEGEDILLPPEPPLAPSGGLVPGATIQEIERDAILRTLEAAGGSSSRAARILDMSVRKIQYKLKEYRQDSAAASLQETVRSVEPSGRGAEAKSPPGKSATFVARNQRSD